MKIPRCHQARSVALAAGKAMRNLGAGGAPRAAPLEGGALTDYGRGLA
jgi:hypothetical protein